MSKTIFCDIISVKKKKIRNGWILGQSLWTNPLWKMSFFLLKSFFSFPNIKKDLF